MSRHELLAENACWIWAPNVSGPNHYVEFSRELHLPDPRDIPVSNAVGENHLAGLIETAVAEVAPVEDTYAVVEAWIQLAAETSLRLFVNGKLIHCGSPREVAPYFYFDTIDLREHLRAGANELRIIAHHQGRDSQSYQAGTPALLVAGKFVSTGGPDLGMGLPAGKATGALAGASNVIEVDLARPSDWWTRRIARYRADAHRLFGCVGFSEHIDFAAKDAEWARACLVAKTPWSERPTALARDMPFLRETVRLAVRAKQAPKDSETISDESASALPPRPDVERLGNGGLLLDMGQEVSGYVELTLHADHAVSVKISYAEALNLEGRVDETKGGMNYSDRLELVAGQTVTWRSYEKRAFRFMQLDAGADTAGLAVIDARVIEQCWPYEPRWENERANSAVSRGKSDMECGDSSPLWTANFSSPPPSSASPHVVHSATLARRIREVSARTIELNTEDLLTDCPWRERAQYLDSQFYMGAMQRLFGTLEPIKRFLHQFPRGADKTGLLRACYPSPSDMTVIPDFSMSYAVLLLRYLELSGDLETVRKNLALAVRGVEVFKQYEDAEGLLIDVPGWIFLDNTFELPKFPRSAGLNAVYHGAYRALAELFRRCADGADTIGHEESAVDFDAKADAVRVAFRKTFLHDGRLLDADSTLEHERYRQWIYHHGPGKGGSFQLRVEFKKKAAAHPLRLAVHGGARVWIDGVVVASVKEGGSWTRSAIYQPVTLPTPTDTEWHRMELEVDWSGIDWECYLSSISDVEWRETTVNGAAAELRVNPWPWLTQTTVGYAAYHGLLEDDEAKALLKACLPARYTFSFPKRTTPFFAEIADLAEGEKRILPCNVPASLFHFCHALKRYGMEAEARDLLLPIYAGMLDRGATTWWEEWNTGSSLCHAWASFVVEFLDTE